MNSVKNIENNFSDNAQKILSKRYLTRDKDGNVTETIEGLFRRVAHSIASAEDKYQTSKYSSAELEDIFFKMMTDLDFMPNSPTLMNAGKPLGQLSACFVLPVEDSMEGIFEAVKNAAIIHKSGGGTGFSFSRLRPSQDIVSSTSGISSGPISFMKVFNVATETIKQGGTRRGANMGILRVDHPDILEFITAKEDQNELTNFNLSVAITDKFMEALECDGEYDLINPRSGEVVKSLKASKVFYMIVERAWKNGEPGIVFIDRINQSQPTPKIGVIESTNPCGEQPLLPYEACNLGSINLSNFVINDNNEYKVDYNRLQKVIDLSVRFLDNVIDVNKYPLPLIDKTTKSNRKIGLGIMGWADMLIKLGIPYDSEEAISLAENVMKFIHDEGWKSSQSLANERGSFPNFENSIYPQIGITKMRNATVTTIAPTGTISMLCGASSGIEPLFALAYEKHVMDNEKLLEVHKEFIKVAKEHGFYSNDLMQRIAKSGSAKGYAEIPEKVQKVFTISHLIRPEWHIKMQAAFQKHTDNAVSKTVNCPNDATKQDIETIFRLAHSLGCKGVTVYRDGSRDSQVLNLTGKKAVDTINQKPNLLVTPRNRPEITFGVTERVKIGCGNLYVTVNSDETGICEVFTSLGRNGGCPSQSEATARLVSMALRAGIEVQEIIDQLKGIRCMSTIRRSSVVKDLKVLSCPDAIGKAIEKYYLAAKQNMHFRSGNNTEKPEKQDLLLDVTKPGSACPECGSTLEHDSGCVICKSCGYSKCG